MGRAMFLLAVVLLGGIYLYLDVYPRFATSSRAQPMRFSHKAHFEDSTCEGCHLYVMELASAGVPTLTECLDCHDGPQSDDPEDLAEEKKLDPYVEEDREIPWELLPGLPSHVFFSHRRHAATSEIECDACHGDIAETSAIPERPPYDFTMEWCIECHEEHEASNDCVACHR